MEDTKHLQPSISLYGPETNVPSSPCFFAIESHNWRIENRHKFLVVGRQG